MKNLITYFFVLLFTFHALYFFKEPEERMLIHEKRMIREFPDSITFTNKGVKEFFIGVDVFLIDRIFKRREILSLLAEANKKLNIQPTENKRVYVGKDNWLYIGGVENEKLQEIADIGVINKSHEETQQKIEIMKQYEGINRFILICPDKGTVYKEFLPDIIRPSNKRYTEPFIKMYSDAGLDVFDTLDILETAKSENNVYYKTDSHWNYLGAYIAAKAFFSFINEKLGTNIEIPNLTFNELPAFSGDLVDLGNLARVDGLPFSDNYSIQWQEKLGNLILIDDDGQVGETLRDKGIGLTIGKPITVKNPQATTNLKVWWFRDSFGLQLSPYFHAAFTEVVHFHYKDFLNPIDEKYGKPDIIVYETVERFI